MTESNESEAGMRVGGESDMTGGESGMTGNGAASGNGSNRANGNGSDLANNGAASEDESGMEDGGVHPPVAPRRPVARTFHGDEFVDDYEWMRDKSSPEVQSYVAGQNRYCEARMAHLAGLRGRLFDELKSHVEETDMSVPTRMDGYWYFTRTQEGRQYAVQCRIPIRGKDDWDPPQVDPKGAPGSMDGEQIVFDANKEAEGHDFFRLGGMDLSKDGRWMLYGVDTAGDERYDYHIRDLSTGEELPDAFPGIGGACFTPDGRYVFWTEVDDSWRPCAIWRHKVGEPAGKVDDGGSDVCVFREDDERFWAGCGLSFDERNLVIVTGSKTTTEVWLLPVATPEGEFSVFIPRVPGIEYDVSFACFEGAGEHGEDIPLAVVQHNAKNPNFEIDVIDMRRHKPPYRLGEGVRVAVGSPYGCEKGDDFEPGAKAMPVGAAYFHPGNPAVLQGAHGLSVEGIAIHRHFVALSYRSGGLPRLAMMTKEQAAADFLAGRPWAFRELTPPALEDDWDIDYEADEAEEQAALAGDDAAGPHARLGAVIDDVDDQLGDDDDHAVGAGVVAAGAAANASVDDGLAVAGVDVAAGVAGGVRDGLAGDGRPVDDIHAAGAGQSAGVNQTDAQSSPVMVTETDGASDDPLPGETRRLYSIGAGGNPSYDAPRMRYSFSSYTRPGELHEVDPTTGHDVLLKRATVLGDFDPRDYMERRVWVTARDGEQIPVSLVWRRDIPMFHAPMFITGYGAYEISSDPGFSVARLSLLDRGVLYAVPHVRGGGEMGRAWYEQGRRLNKRHTFEDFVDATRALQRSGLASRRRTVANGGSAGGLLMGAIANMAPESYAGIEADVPFVDALTSILNPDLPLTVTEWDEWGDPLHDETVYRYMKTYTPYENVPAVAGTGVSGSDGVGSGAGARAGVGATGSDGANGGAIGATGDGPAGAGAKSDGVQVDGRSASGGTRATGARRVASFPRIFITTSMNDTRVLYVEPLKWLARLQASGVDAVAKIEVEAGHGGISGRYKQWQEVSYENAWCLDVMGLSR